MGNDKLNSNTANPHVLSSADFKVANLQRGQLLVWQLMCICVGCLELLIKLCPDFLWTACSWPFEINLIHRNQILERLKLKARDGKSCFLLKVNQWCLNDKKSTRWDCWYSFYPRWVFLFWESRRKWHWGKHFSYEQFWKKQESLNILSLVLS